MHTPSMPVNDLVPQFPAGVLSAPVIEQLLEVHFPQIHLGGRVFFIEGAGVKRARMRMCAHEKNLRPGNTLSGPSMFQLADLALYVAILATVGVFSRLWPAMKAVRMDPVDALRYE